jgi:signal-transduction protein with cAMP-binding, CBS, and nucleotidyltransferase domain
MALLMPGRTAGRYIRDRARTVGDVMTRGIVSVDVNSSIDDTVDLMEACQIRRVPAVEQERLAGIVSRSDILRALLAASSDESETSISDAEIRKLALAEIGKQHWASRWSTDIAVKEGVVSLRGVVTSERERSALRVACENIAGVKAVRDELTCVEPFSGTVVEER